MKGNTLYDSGNLSLNLSYLPYNASASVICYKVNHLSTFIIRDVVFVTVVIQEFYPLHTKFGFQRPWGVVDPCMNNSTIVSTLMKC